jgi:hypothetical protein
MVIEVNNGFVLALTLFRVHGTTMLEMRATSLPDLRVSMGSTHLTEMEIPTNLSKELKSKVTDFKDKILNHVKNPPVVDWTIGDYLFKECDDILIEIDKEIFNLKDTEKKFN